MKNRVILETIESIRNSYFWSAQFLERDPSQKIFDQCDFGKNRVWRKFSDSLLSHLLNNNTWTSVILERMESYIFFGKAYYCIYIIQTPSWLGLRGAPTTCHNKHGALRSYSFGQIWADRKQIFVLIPMWFLCILAFWARCHRARVIYLK